MKKSTIEFGIITFIVMALSSVVSIILNNDIAYPICFNLNLILALAVIISICKEVKTYKSYEVKFLKLHIADLLMSIGIICLIGSPLLQMFFDLTVLSYILNALGLSLAILGEYYEYYLFNFVFKRKECTE